MYGLPLNPVLSHLEQFHSGGSSAQVIQTHTHTPTRQETQTHHTYFVWIVEDLAAQVSVQELIEVCHQALSFHSSLPRCVHPLQLVTKMANLGCHVANMLIKLLEMLKGHLTKKRAFVITVSMYWGYKYTVLSTF